jgi:hypothetical protein
LAKESADSFVAKFPAMIKELVKQRVQGAAAKPLQAYVGKYYNSIHNLFIEISLVNDSLYLAFQGGRDNQIWKMEHYQYDICHETKLSNTPGFHMLGRIFTRLNSRLAKMSRLGRYCGLMRLAGLIQNSLRGRTEKQQQLRMTSSRSHSKYCKCPYLKTLYSNN